MDTAITKPAMHPAVEELKSISVFADLPAEGLDWLAAQMEVLDLHPGEILVREGEAAEHLAVVFAGEIRAELGDGRVYTAHAGQVTGLLPYSRLTHYRSTVHAVMGSRVARLHKSYFAEMLQQMPELNQQLVSVMADRIRQATVADQQREKLVALGKLSAALAHELNNPAAAIRRGSDSLRHAIISVRTAALQLDNGGLPQPARLFLARLDRDWIHQAGAHSALDSLERSDREEEFITWLESRHVPNAQDLATALVDAGCERNTLEEVARQIPPEFLADALTRLTASFTISRLIEEMEGAAGKISELVRAVKEYSYMDQMPAQEVDIHNGLENTLIMLRHRLKYGVEIVRDYDRALPAIWAHGSELNQVWTNLISNAIDAMNGNGKLRIRTAREMNCAVVEVIDNGPASRRNSSQEFSNRSLLPNRSAKGPASASIRFTAS